MLVIATDAELGAPLIYSLGRSGIIGWEPPTANRVAASSSWSSPSTAGCDPRGSTRNTGLRKLPLTRMKTHVTHCPLEPLRPQKLSKAAVKSVCDRMRRASRLVP